MFPHVQFGVCQYPGSFLPRLFPARWLPTCASACGSSVFDVEFDNFFCWASWGFWQPLFSPWGQTEMLPKMFEFILFILLGIYFHLWNNAVIFLLKPFHTCTDMNARRNEYDHEVSLTAYPTTLNFRNLCLKLQKWLVINLCTQKSK